MPSLLSNKVKVFVGGARETGRCLRACVAFAEDPDSVPSTDIIVPIPGNQMLSMTFVETRHTHGTCSYTRAKYSCT